MKLNQADLELVRNHNQYSDLYLSVFQPRIIFQAQINDAAIGHGAIIITFNNVTTGSFSAIESGMTMLVGSSIGASNLGRIRVRSATSSQITVSENSNIQWTNLLYLTVLRYWEVWPVYPRIIQNPNKPIDTIWYKDYDILYTNQNSTLGTFVNAGPNRAINLNNGSAQLWYSSTGTYNLLGNALTYDWSFEGGTPTGSASADPGYITYNTAGDYVTRLKITDAVNGVVDTAYRYVSIRANPQFPRWELKSLAGSRTEGGYRAQIIIYDTITIDENSAVVLYSDDYYGSAKKSLGGNYPNSSSIFFSGYVIKDAIQYDYQLSTVTFEIASITDVMKGAESFSISVQSVAAPSQWYHLYDLNISRALYHYLRWHSTVLSVADFQFSGTDYKLQFFDAKRESLYAAIDSLMKNTMVGGVVADRQGKVWMEVSTESTPNATGTFVPSMNITTRDWMNAPVVDEVYNPPVSYLEYGGIAYSGVLTGTFSALMACAPGNAPAFRGKATTLQGLALSDQNQLNTLVGNIAANKNARFPIIKMDLTGNYSNLDIAPQEAVQVVINPADTVKNVSINAPYRSERHTWKWDGERRSKTLGVELSPIISAPPGESIIIPPQPPGGMGGIGGGGFPSLPPIPPFALGFGNQAVTKIHGSFSTIIGQPNPFIVGGVDFSYSSGFVGTTATGTSSVGFVTVHGIYNLSLLLECSPVAATYFVGYVNTSIIANQFGLYFPTADSNFVNWNNYFEFAAGDLIKLYAGVQYAARVSGNFWLTAALVFALP